MMVGVVFILFVGGAVVVGGAFLLMIVSDRMDTDRSTAHPKPDNLYIDNTVLTELDQNRKIAAIKHYRLQTGLGLKEAKEAVEYIEANRHDLDRILKDKSRRLEDMPVGAGVRDLVEAGDIDGAVQAYAQFMGVDEYTARDAVEKIRAER